MIATDSPELARHASMNIIAEISCIVRGASGGVVQVTGAITVPPNLNLLYESGWTLRRITTRSYL